MSKSYSSILRSALNTIQASGLSAAELSRRTGLSLNTCSKVLRDKEGQMGYHWSTVEFALKKVGVGLKLEAAPEEPAYSRRYNRRATGRRDYYESRA